MDKRCDVSVMHPGNVCQWNHRWHALHLRCWVLRWWALGQRLDVPILCAEGVHVCARLEREWAVVPVPCTRALHDLLGWSLYERAEWMQYRNQLLVVNAVPDSSAHHDV